MKKIIIFATTALVISGSVFALSSFKNNSDNKKFNTKVVGSDLNNGSFKSGNTIMYFEKIKLKDLDQLVEHSDAFVLAEVIQDAETVIKENPKGMPEDPATFTTYSVTEIKVIDTLYGNIDSEILTFTQIGEPGNSEGETKVIKGEKYLFALNKHDWGYNSSAQEEGIFKIVNNNKIYSLTDNPVMSKYDNLDLDKLKKDLSKSFNKKKK
jgi:hypothetical protein